METRHADRHCADCVVSRRVLAGKLVPTRNADRDPDLRVLGFWRRDQTVVEADVERRPLIFRAVLLALPAAMLLWVIVRMAR